MGTIGNQPPRNTYRVSNEEFEQTVRYMIDVSRRYAVPFADVVALYAATEAERRNNIAVQHGDYLDEQAGGLGGRIEGVEDAINNVSVSVDELRRPAK